ncbi:hypothetical protein F511_25946 [Dorcoceras hygrometricum]|uniref:Uncharacterized protein n=1 Tax=Dorcoceras hygrometricum TaxID=472368 RepID=A0A2Z7BBF8_9LAMI|nr:hypothetical protein F511_25946 [Dorcoceras hygrometricum]
MEEVKAHQILRDPWFPYENHLKSKGEWLKVDHDEDGDSSHEGSSVSLSSCDTIDDVSSTSPPSSSGSLYDLSELMLELPVKRGLSKFYQGKSESFTSLSRVTSVEDLAKNCRRKTKSPKRSRILPRPIISKAKKLDTDKKRLGTLIRSSRQKENGVLIHPYIDSI